jgi:hypothetical protein
MSARGAGDPAGKEIPMDQNPLLSLPEALGGWGACAKDSVYDRGNLYDYLDGGAELYLSFSFQMLSSRTYSRAGQPDIVVDVFDMTSSKDAFGVFSLSRETAARAFGQGSQYTEGSLLFWKDRYFVSILASPETPEAKAVAFDIARLIDDAIPRESPPPEILDLLPPDSLDGGTVRYFRHRAWLDAYYFLADENILHIDETTEAALARYGSRGARTILLLVLYADDGEARRACEDFKRYYLPELSHDAVVRIEDGAWSGARTDGRLLAAVFDAADNATASALLDAALDRYRANRRQP